MKLLTEKQRQKVKNGKMQLVDKGGSAKGTKAQPITRTAALESLVITVQNAVRQVANTNEKTVELMDSVVLSLKRELPVPILQVDAPILNVSDFPAPVFPEPPRHWRVRVTHRDNRGLIQEVDLERIE